MVLDRKALHEACLDVARSIHWKKKPIDKLLVDVSSKLYFDEALRYEDFIIGQGRDPNIIVRAIKYIANKHAIPPMTHDLDAFSTALEVLVELACPNTGTEPEQEQFFKDIEEGLQDAKRDYT
ncbi:hypothetical protein [Thiothrix sp.]|jgi:hypothetical protein|uniref:hypothetical protein n=1 Tax=Thiothrix sp. TaxID=1032 RepID=UPI002580BB3B|nr:hypothetical protein [Thiothrix sp.]